MMKEERNEEQTEELIGNHKRVCATVDLDAVLYNMEQMHQNIKNGAKMMGVIKTNGYGHGATPIAKQLEKLDYVFGYATATVEEALKLREDGIKKPILILGYTFPYCYENLVTEEIRPAVFRLDMAKELSEKAVSLGKTLKIHVKVDTGMTRVGIYPDEKGLSFVKEVSMLPGLEIEGMFTHFARADETDKTYAFMQFRKFKKFTDRVKAELGISIPICHCANSASIVELPETHMDMVRAGITLYGLWPSEEVSKEIISLKPVLSLYSHIAFLKDVPKGVAISYGGTYVTPDQRRIATIPVGYGDGYPRGLSGKGYVLIRGQKAPICGRVCMDQFMVDVTDISDVQEGDLVTLIGKDGSESITMEELGGISGRFNYELACDLGQRIPRVYIKNNKICE